MTQDEARKALIARREALALEDVSNADSRNTVELQQDSVGRLSRMDALQQQAMAKAQARRRRQEFARIEAALARIEEGEWGWCATCGEAIAQGRLSNDPSVAVCVNCAARTGA